MLSEITFTITLSQLIVGGLMLAIGVLFSFALRQVIKNRSEVSTNEVEAPGPAADLDAITSIEYNGITIAATVEQKMWFEGLGRQQQRKIIRDLKAGKPIEIYTADGKLSSYAGRKVADEDPINKELPVAEEIPASMLVEKGKSHLHAI